jgi:hypothetical protein
MKKHVLGPKLNKAYYCLTHFVLCDFDAIWCAILLAARQDIWAKQKLGFHVLSHF